MGVKKIRNLQIVNGEQTTSRKILFKQPLKESLLWGKNCLL
jgi:hypothetical protein